MLKKRADLLAVFYMLCTTGIFITHWSMPEFNIFLFLGAMVMATTCFAVAHNHAHHNMWKFGILNRLTDYWLTLFYGFPIYAWIPTHNLNHHRYSNKEGDHTATWRYSQKNNLLVLLAYPVMSAIYQQTPTSQFLKHEWKTNKGRFLFFISQYVVWALCIAGAVYIDWHKALYCMIIPGAFSVIGVHMINFIQHVHCDENSAYNHSRNFTGLGSRLLLNAGFHTIHHERVDMHWSDLSVGHAQIASKIDPALIEKSLLWYILRVYIFSIFVPQWRSQPLVKKNQSGYIQG
jgi:beta-carotene hydroxylase